MKFVSKLLIGMVLVVTCSLGFAQDPVKLTPQKYKVLLENDQVRVLDVRCKAGEKEPMHSHPGFVVYVVKPGKYKVGTPDGKISEQEGKPGTAVWVDPVTHTFECLNDQHYIVTELKNAAKP